MPEYLSPGVYVEEFEIGGKPIEGVSTSTAGFLGQTERGPTVPRFITGTNQFQRLYGGYSWPEAEEGETASSFLPYAVEGFFANGGKRCFVGRVVGKGSKTASLSIPARGTAGDETPGSTETPSSDPGTGGPGSGTGAGPAGSGSTGSPTRAGGRASASKPEKVLFEVRASGPGLWGNRIGVEVTKAGLSEMNERLFKLVVSYWHKQGKGCDPVVVEEYDNLSPDVSSPDYYAKRINAESSLIEIEEKDAQGQAPKQTKGAEFLEGGSDEDIELSDYKGSSESGPGEKTGLEAFGEVDEISIVCAPNENDVTGLTDALVGHCERMKDRFAVLQCGQSAGLVSKIRPPIDSKYAAYYYPWLKVVDPPTGMVTLVPPGGHIVGVYARSDIERGVHKAPANEPVRGVTGLQFPITKGVQDILNPRGVNCIRSFVGRGTRVWGARTTSSDPLWKYVNVRRLFLFLEESIEEATQWVVFEPNDQRLWDRVKQTVSDFLTRVWRDGALMGTTPEEAFFVKCDETTMTPSDIDNGRLIVTIGVAPVKPAEFVIFRIAQWRGGSSATE